MTDPTAACLFCRIIRGEIPANKVYEDDHVFAFEDISPQAPTHVLIIPKKHISDIGALSQKDITLVGEMVLMAKKLSENLPSGSQHFRLSVNNGTGAGQSVFHLHFHFLSGKTFLEDVCV